MSLFFTQRKFLSYSLASQHKKAAELVKKLYLELLYKKIISKELIDQMTLLCQWMTLEMITLDLSSLSNRYHLHVQHANLHLKEHQLLPSVAELDSPTSCDFLDIDIYLENIRSAFNIGSMMRTNEATRLGSLYFSKEMASPSSKKVLDTAMGTHHFQTPKVLDKLTSLKSPLIAIETGKEASALYEFSFPQSFSLIFGNEETGISPITLKAADHVLHIPLCGIKNSLNVASAFSIVAYEIRRQKESYR